MIKFSYAKNKFQFNCQMNNYCDFAIQLMIHLIHLLLTNYILCSISEINIEYYMDVLFEKIPRVECEKLYFHAQKYTLSYFLWCTSGFSHCIKYSNNIRKKRYQTQAVGPSILYYCYIVSLFAKWVHINIVISASQLLNGHKRLPFVKLACFNQLFNISMSILCHLQYIAA